MRDISHSFSVKCFISKHETPWADFQRTWAKAIQLLRVNPRQLPQAAPPKCRVCLHDEKAAQQHNSGAPQHNGATWSLTATSSSKAVSPQAYTPERLDTAVPNENTKLWSLVRMHWRRKNLVFRKKTLWKHITRLQFPPQKIHAYKCKPLSKPKLRRVAIVSSRHWTLERSELQRNLQTLNSIV